MTDINPLALAALLFSLSGAMILGASIAFSPQRALYRLAQMRWNANPDIFEDLWKNRRLARFGTLHLAIGVLIGAASELGVRTWSASAACTVAWFLLMLWQWLSRPLSAAQRKAAFDKEVAIDDAEYAAIVAAEQKRRDEGAEEG